MMEGKVDFIEISILNDNNQVTNPMHENEFYEWLYNNSMEGIISIPVLKYRADNEEYNFSIERSKIPVLHKWDAHSPGRNPDRPPLNFTFDWKRKPDFKLDFERKLREELEKCRDNSFCVCKQKSIVNEKSEGNSTTSDFWI